MNLRSLLSGWGNKPQKETDLKGLISSWINNLEKYCSPPKAISALNFGLFESDKGFMIYLIGSKLYDPSNDDWATEVDYEPIPLYKYLLLSGNDIADLKWDEILQQVNSVLKDIIEKSPNHSLFKNRVVTTGFDDGDLTVIKT